MERHPPQRHRGPRQRTEHNRRRRRLGDSLGGNWRHQPQAFNKAHKDAWWYHGNETATWIYYFGTQQNTASHPIYALSEPLTLPAVPVLKPGKRQGRFDLALLPTPLRRP